MSQCSEANYGICSNEADRMAQECYIDFNGGAGGADAKSVITDWRAYAVAQQALNEVGCALARDSCITAAYFGF